MKTVEELKKQDPQKILKQMLDLKKQIPHPASQQANSENCPYGNYIYNSKSCYWAFNSYYAENSGFIYFCGLTKNCWDIFHTGGTPETKRFAELCYENVYTDFCYSCGFLTYSEGCMNCHYGTKLLNCSDCFGCVGLSNKKYCILNNQLTKVQYEKTVKEIKKGLGWNI